MSRIRIFHHQNNLTVIYHTCDHVHARRTTRVWKGTQYDLALLLQVHMIWIHGAILFPPDSYIREGDFHVPLLLISQSPLQLNHTRASLHNGFWPYVLLHHDHRGSVSFRGHGWKPYGRSTTAPFVFYIS